MKRRAGAAIAVRVLGPVLATLQATAAAAAACDEDARVIFSCAVRGDRCIQLCAAQEGSTDRDYLEYRFGRSAEGAGAGADPPEFVFPADRRGSLKRFFGATYSRNGLFTQSVRFATRGAEYTVFTEFRSPSRLRSGVRVRTLASARATEILCDERPRFYIHELRGRIACDPATAVGRACIG